MARKALIGAGVAALVGAAVVVAREIPGIKREIRMWRM
jgi:hypothetical protein